MAAVQPVNVKVNVSAADSILPDELIADMVAYWRRPNVLRQLLREPPWEERLDRAIEQRSIRYRFRAVRFEWTGRLSLAYDALRGRHYCADDD